MSDPRPDHFRRYCLPYCLHRLSDGTWLPLNRNYKPLGITGGEAVDYETAPTEMRLALTPADLRALSIGAAIDGAQVLLYDDDCVPRPGTPHWATYCARLERLAMR